MVTLYNVISSDGFIAETDGSEDFIPDELWPSTLDFYTKYDALVMGRKTYEAIQAYPEELLKPFEALPIKKIVMTRNMKFLPKEGYAAAHVPDDAFAFGQNTLVTSGPTFNTFLLENKLADRVVFHRLPVEIGKGIRPFDESIKESLVLESETEKENGVTEISYRITQDMKK